MAIISDSFLQKMAALGEKLALKDDCEILEDVEGALDSMGGAPHARLPHPELGTWPVKTTKKSAVLKWNPPSQDYAIANQIVGLATRKVLLPLGTVVQKNNHLLIKGTTYRVIGPAPDVSYDVFTEVIVVVTTMEGSLNG